MLPARKLWGANILRRGHQMGRIYKYQPAKGGEVKKVLLILLSVVAWVGGIFLLIDAAARPFSVVGKVICGLFTGTALILWVSVLFWWLSFRSEKPSEKPEREPFYVPFIFLGVCVMAWIGSYHVGTSPDYPVVVIEERNGEIQIMDEGGRFIFPFTGKIVGFPKEINLGMNIRIDKDGLREEWPVLVTLTMEGDVGTLEKKIEFLRQHDLSHLSQWERVLKGKVKEQLKEIFSKEIEEYLPQVVKKEKITLPLPSTGLRYGGYKMKEIKISRPKIFYLRQQ